MWTKENISSQAGKIIIVTGGNAGIGFETAKAFYENGAHVILACRDLDKGQSAIDKIEKKAGAGKIDLALLDLSSLASVAEFAETFKQKYKELHLLINNAGIMTPPQALTAEGYESQFGVNFLGHFALTGHLYPLIKKTKASRIITLTSLGYTYGSIDFDNLKSEKSYDAFREYCQSKLADLLFTVELQRRITAKGDQVLSLAAHPGITKTDLSRHMSADEIAAAIERLGALMETEQGALPTLYAAVSPEVAESGFYGPDADGGLRGYPAAAAILENALDEAVAQRLWKMAEEATGLVFP
jgi:NAD(P)-dependent dehydrogenase (short-subunit alcohol dehydrogenase family)